MNKRLILDVVVIIAIAVLITAIVEFNLSETMMPYMFIVVLSFYFLGKYVHKIFRK